jgi:hypothetical protein
MAKSTWRILVVAGTLGPLAVACGARGPLDISGENNNNNSFVDASTLDGHGGDGAQGQDTSTPEDAAPDSPPNPIQCATCVATKCGMQVQGCITSTSCRTILQCVIQKCVSMGKGSDPTCLAGCAGGDPSGVLQAVAVVECITMQCGPACLGVIPGTGGDTVPPGTPAPPPKLACVENSCGE